MKEPIYVKKSVFGMGVFASRDIKKGEKICSMKGDVVHTWLTKKLAESKRDTTDLLQIGVNRYIHMRKPYLLINHSCAPNAAIVGLNTLVAIAVIKKDSEIFYDYSTTWYDGFLCDCGNKNCRGNISDFFSLPAGLQKRYTKSGNLPDYIRKEAARRHARRKKRQ